MQNVLQTIVINLDRSPTRLQKISNQLNSLRIPFTRFAAIDGGKLSEEEIRKTTTWACRNFLCNKSVVGCALSHLRIWQQIVAMDTPGDELFLILEDDAVLPPDFNQKMSDIFTELADQKLFDKFDIFYLYCVGDCRENVNDGKFATIYGKTCSKIYGKENPLIFKSNIIHKANFALSTVGYMINRRGAEKAIKFIDKIDYHIDNQLASQVPLVALYSPVISIDLDEVSTIGTNTFPFLLGYILNKLGAKQAAWILNIPAVSIRMKYVLTIAMLLYLVILFILFFVNPVAFYIFLSFVILEFLLSRLKK